MGHLGLLVFFHAEGIPIKYIPDRYRISGKRRMLRGKGHHVYAHWGDVSHYGSKDVDSMMKSARLVTT